MSDSHPEWLRSFGRRIGRPLRPRQQALLEAARGTVLLDPQAVALELAAFARTHPRLALEIGFGGGEFLAETAARNPDMGYIGCEPFTNGVVKLLDAIEQRGLRNIRILAEDARLVLEALPEASLEQAYILFPDPWPKARHHKRRIIQEPTIAMLARAIKPGGGLLLATDHLDYSAWMLAQMLASPHFRWTAERESDWTTPPPGWTTTRYETKTGLEGRSPVFYGFVREGD